MTVKILFSISPRSRFWVQFLTMSLASSRTIIFQQYNPVHKYKLDQEDIGLARLCHHPQVSPASESQVERGNTRRVQSVHCIFY